ncbi:hypothetical protein RESH_04863 [Rhodopirellula europaea SH398]|uniref:Uncharacterized protein n=2 Tax=Rhodopirellula europaea TaxID=1263866 RepID=M2ABH5_9BACT|nr:hypothetical protein RE6C_05149 [Rhodopirellula europaea 6C]EMI24492.1 hypothetical protein RESH_04863 [Rhodopirellula europaea SH398]|tara:strand:- start:7559 stop:7708 length:150 start_codon:yes stop_codon:yes gene_type:complete
MLSDASQEIGLLLNNDDQNDLSAIARPKVAKIRRLRRLLFIIPPPNRFG